MLGIIFALFASVSFAFGYTILKKSYSNFPPSVAFFIDVLLGILIWIPFGLFFGIQYTHFSIVLVYALISAILAEAFFFYVLSKGEVSITGTILASYPIYTVLFSLFINNERLPLISWIFVILTILGTIIVSSPSKIRKQELGNKKYILWALAGALSVGLADSLNKHIISQTSASTFIFALALVQIPVGIIYLRLEKQSLKQFQSIFTNLEKYRMSMYGALLNIIGTLFLLLSFQYSLVSIVAPIGASYPGIMVILAMLWLKEKLTKKDILGLIVIIVGVIGISTIG
jgi:transporter family protein